MHVFLSYHFKDKDFTDRLVADLRAAGVRVWRDIDAIAAGQDFARETQAALESAGTFLIVSSARSELLDYMGRDFAAAVRSNMPVILVRADEKARLRIEERYLQAVIDLHDNYDQGIAALVNALPETVKQDQPVQPEAPQSRGYVFISYAHDDADFVEQLREFLKTKGYGYWDYQDSDRNYHAQLFLELEEVIRGAAATISVLSPAWKRSKWATKEYIFSEDVGTPVFLVMAREMGPTLVTAGMTYIDFTQDESNGYDRLDRELRRKGLL